MYTFVKTAPKFLTALRQIMILLFLDSLECAEKSLVPVTSGLPPSQCGWPPLITACCYNIGPKFIFGQFKDHSVTEKPKAKPNMFSYVCKSLKFYTLYFFIHL